MKIILTEDVRKIGRKGDIAEVSTGYARNYIIPQKLGVEATPDNLNKWKLKKQHDDKVAAENLASARQQAEELKGKFIETSMKVGNNGKAFGSVSTKEIAELIQKQLGIEVDKKKISLDVPAKALGNYKVSLKLHPEVTAEITLRVVEAKEAR